MRHRSLLILTSVLTTGALTLTACGSRDDDDGKKSGSDGGKHHRRHRRRRPADRPELRHRPRHPVRRRRSPSTTPTRTTGPGVTFKVKALDDKAHARLRPAERHRARRATTSVIGVVGPLNSGVAQSMQQVFDDRQPGRDLARPTPTPTLTQGKNWATGKKSRPFKTYFRTATTDAIQGGFAAEYAYNDAEEEEGLRRRRQADLRRRPGRASSRTSSPSLGGKVAGTDHVNTGDTDFSALVTKIKNSERRPRLLRRPVRRVRALTKQLKDGRRQDPADGRRRHVHRRPTSRPPAPPPRATSPPPSACPSTPCPPPRTSSPNYKAAGLQGRLRHLRRLLLRRRHRHHQGRQGRRDANDGKLPATTPAPSSSTRSRRPTSTASPATSPSTSTATPPTSSSPSTRSRAASGSRRQERHLQRLTTRTTRAARLVTTRPRGPRRSPHQHAHRAARSTSPHTLLPATWRPCGARPCRNSWPTGCSSARCTGSSPSATRWCTASSSSSTSPTARSS